MQLERTCLLVSVVLLVTTGTAFGDTDQILRFFSFLSDSGHATNCGKVPFNISWTPKIVTAYEPLVFTMNYTFPHALNGGTYNLTMTQHGMSQPFMTYANPIDCDDIKKLFKCPVPEGFVINRSDHWERTDILRSFPGRYTVRADVKNEKGQQMICVQMDVTIKES